MGNVFDNRSSLLAKHWNQVAPNTYRNTITDQLIDSHHLTLHSEEELSFNNSLLLKRAALSHPNVPKLIYFSPSSTPLCGSSSHGVTLYLEHTQPLPKLSEQSTNLCACCAIVNGLLYLSDRYGWFKVQEGLIRGGQESGLQGKQTIVPKIWIHSDLKLNYPAATTTEFQMSRQTANLLMSLTSCLSRSDSPLLPNILKCSGLEQLAQAIFQVHNQAPELVARKRTVSQLRNQSSQSFLIDQHPPRPQGQHLLHFTMKPPPQAKLYTPVSTIRENKDNVGESITVEKIFPRRTQEAFPSAEMDRSKRRVNFSFLDVMTTPKSNKIPPPPLQNKLCRSSSVLEPHSKSILQIDSNKIKHPQPQQLNAISNFNPAFRQQENDFLIQEEQSDSRLKELLRATDRDPSYSTLGTQQLQPSPISALQQEFVPPRKQSRNQICSELIHQKKLREDSEVKGSFEGQWYHREDSKGKGVEIQEEAEKRLERQSEIQICSIGLGKNEKSGGFEIVSEYHISVDQQAGFGSLQIQRSLEYNGSQHDRIPEPSVLYCKSQAFNYSQRDHTPSCAQGKISALKSGDQIQSPVQGAQGAQGAQDIEKGYKKYINNLQEVTLSQSNLQASQTPKSERNYSIKETFNERVDDNKHLTSSSNPKKLKKEACRSRQVGIPDSSCARMKAGGSSWREVDVHSKESQFCEEEQKRATIMAKISNTEEVLRENRKKLELLQLEKDLQKEKNIIKQEMQSLLVNNMMADESHRIKEKVRHKKATFAQLKAEASKILEDLDF